MCLAMRIPSQQMSSEDSGACERAVAPARNRSLEKTETNPDATVGNISATEEVVPRELRKPRVFF